MGNQLNLKNIVLSFLYIITVAALLLLVNTGFSWLFNNVFSDMFNWFNERSLAIKIILLLIGIAAIVKLALNIFTLLSSVLGNILLKKFPSNYVTHWVSFILFVVSVYYNIKELWRLPDGYDFWIIAELLLISFFIIGFNFAIIQPNFKIQKRN